MFIVALSCQYCSSWLLLCRKMPSRPSDRSTVCSLRTFHPKRGAPLSQLNTPLPLQFARHYHASSSPLSIRLSFTLTSLPNPFDRSLSRSTRQTITRRTLYRLSPCKKANQPGFKNCANYLQVVFLSYSTPRALYMAASVYHSTRWDLYEHLDPLVPLLQKMRVCPMISLRPVGWKVMLCPAPACLISFRYGFSKQRQYR